MLYFVGGLYLCASIVCFIAYWIDKRAARAGRWRTPEHRLLLLGLIGGWPGALLAHRWLQHKSTKASFRRKFWITVALNLGALGYLLWLYVAATHVRR